MDEHYQFVEREPSVRIRPEGEDTFLLYHPGTDELHLIDARSKTIFEACDGRSIDAVIDDGVTHMCTTPTCDEQRAAVEVLDFLCNLQRRSLVRFF